MFYKSFVFFITAIRLGDEDDFDQIFSIVNVLVESNALQEAYDIYISLVNKFPYVSKLSMN